MISTYHTQMRAHGNSYLICRPRPVGEVFQHTDTSVYICLAAHSTMSYSSSIQLEPPVEHPNIDATNDSDIPGDQIVQWFEQLFEKSTTFATILAAVMFSAMILDFDTIRIPHGSRDQVRTWAATGAILFVLLVLLCTGCTLALKFHGMPIAMKYNAKVALVRFGFQFVSFLFQGLLLTGTLFFCLVVRAFVPAVGWTAFGITSGCLVVCFVLWMGQLQTEIRTQRRIANGRTDPG